MAPLDQEVARELDRLERRVDAFAPTARQVIETDARSRALADDMDDFKQWLREVEQRMNQRIDGVSASLREIVRAQQAEVEARRKGRQAVVVAVIAGCFTIIASLLASAAALIQAAG